jgi:hypothetical protein
MTRYSAPIIHKCPACAGYFKRHTLTSMHFHADVPDWSDGKNGQWWASASGSVGRCPVCATSLWIEDAVEVMRLPRHTPTMVGLDRLWHRMTGDRHGRLREVLEWEGLPTAIKNAERLDWLSKADDFIAALTEAPPQTRERELHLRVRLWWALNDHRRYNKSSSPTATHSDLARPNMVRILALIEDSPKAQVTRGELLRQLGRFDDAVAVLKAVVPDGRSEVRAVRIERLARAGISELQALNEESTTSMPGQADGQDIARRPVW